MAAGIYQGLTPYEIRKLAFQQVKKNNTTIPES